MRTYGRHGSAVTAVALLPAAGLMATASRDGEVRIWTMKDQRVTDQLAPLFFTNGRNVLTATYAGGLGTVIGDIEKGGVPIQLDQSERKQAMYASFDADGGHVFVGYEGSRVCSYEVKPPRLERCCELDGQPTAMMRTSDGKQLWIGFVNGSAAMCELATGMIEQRLAGTEDRDRGAVVGFGSDRNDVVAARADGTLWKLGAEARELPATDATTAAVGADGTLIATVSTAGGVRIHRATDHWAPHELGRHMGRVDRLALTRDGQRVLACTTNAACSLWTIGQPGVKEVFWPRGEYIEMSRDGSLVITAVGGAFLAWSPSQPGRPIELGREDAPGQAYEARLSDDGRYLTTIWLDRGGEDGIPTERMSTWRMDWSEIVQSIRSKTTACLDPKKRVALLDEKPDEAQHAYDRCALYFGMRPLAVSVLASSPELRPKASHVAALPRLPEHGYFTRVAFRYSDAKSDFSATRELPPPTSKQVEPVWNAMLVEVKRLGGAQLVPETEKFVGTIWTPTPLDVPALANYIGLAGWVSLETSPSDRGRNPLIITCLGKDRTDEVRLLTVPLSLGDIFDVAAARDGRSAMPAQRLVDLVAGSCAGASLLAGKPLAVDHIDPADVALPEFHKVAVHLPGQPTAAADPKMIGTSISRIEWSRTKYSADAFAKVFGHAPATAVGEP